jgi:hypothetical protein
LFEGNSVRATVRMTGVCKDTVLKLLCDLGKFCAAYHNSQNDVEGKRTATQDNVDVGAIGVEVGSRLERIDKAYKMTSFDAIIGAWSFYENHRCAG